MAGWLDYVAAVSTAMRDCEPKLFPERSRGLCSQNTDDGRRQRKERARELTRINMTRKGERK